jgi:hypothetical protein
MVKVTDTSLSCSTTSALSIKRRFSLPSRSLPLLVLLWAAVLHPGPACAQEPVAPALKSDEKAADHRSSHLIACPDCLREVSRRAVSCPHCGCPGLAISEAVAAAEQAARPLPVLRAVSDRGTEHALVVEENGMPYALLDARILAGAQTLSLTTLGEDKPVTYLRLEAAAEVGLVRLALAPEEQAFARLQLSTSAADKATAVMTITGKSSPADFAPGATSHPATTLATLDSAGHVIAVALAAIGGDNSERAAITPCQKWIQVSPADYRSQTALLLRLAASDDKAAPSQADRDSIQKTVWLTPFLQKSANALLAATPKP